MFNYSRTVRGYYISCFSIISQLSNILKILFELEVAVRGWWWSCREVACPYYEIWHHPCTVALEHLEPHDMLHSQSTLVVTTRVNWSCYHSDITIPPPSPGYRKLYPRAADSLSWDQYLAIMSHYTDRLTDQHEKYRYMVDMLAMLSDDSKEQGKLVIPYTGVLWRTALDQGVWGCGSSDAVPAQS